MIGLTPFSRRLRTVRLGEVVDKGVDSYADDVFTTPASLAGLPALSIPCGQDRTGLPIGLQLMGELNLARSSTHVLNEVVLSD